MKRLFWLLLIPIAFIINVIASNFQAFTENVLSLGFYKISSQIVSFVFSLVPFSVAEVLLIAIPLVLVTTLIISIYKSIKRKNFKSIKTFGINVAVGASFIYFLFVMLCGVNYYRYNFEYYYFENEGKSQYSAEKLEKLCVHLIEEGSKLRSEISDADLEVSAFELSQMAYESFVDFKKDYDVFSATYSKPKPILLSALMSHTQITGFYFPFTVEANVNVAFPSYEIPFTMLHEQAHQYGFMREDEANFIAFLAGENSKYDIVKYSAYMSASVYAMNSLYSADSERFNRVYQIYSEKQLEDKKDSRDYWEQFEDKIISNTFTQVNDTYLKANGQTEGVVSYGKVTELLLRDFYSNKFN